MLLTRAKYEFMTLHNSADLDQGAIAAFLEKIGRVCYKSEERIGPGTAEKFCRHLLAQVPPHESVLEHVSLTVKFTTDRGVSHELVRHRIAAYSQESTRYCNYGKKGVTFIIPGDIDLPEGQCTVYLNNIVAYDNKTMEIPMDVWYWALALQEAETAYNRLLSYKWSPQRARAVLPNALKTEIIATYDLRQWRHVLRTRTMEKVHPQMRELTVPLLADLKQQLPIFFGDINNA